MRSMRRRQPNTRQEDGWFFQLASLYPFNCISTLLAGNGMATIGTPSLSLSEEVACVCLQNVVTHECVCVEMPVTCTCSSE